MQKKKKTQKNKTQKNKKNKKKTKNPRAWGRALKSVVWTLIGNGKLTSQIVSLKAIVRT